MDKRIGRWLRRGAAALGLLLLGLLLLGPLAMLTSGQASLDGNRALRLPGLGRVRLW